MSRLRPLAALAALPFLASPALAEPVGVCASSTVGSTAVTTGTTVAVCRVTTINVDRADPLRDAVCDYLADHPDPSVRALHPTLCNGEISGLDICIILSDEADLDPYRDDLATICPPLDLICNTIQPVCELLPAAPVQGKVIDVAGVVVVEVGEDG